MQFKIVPLAGDASFRSFFRLKSSKSSKIIAFAQKEKYKNLVAYTAVNNFLKNNKILAPKTYNYNFSKGIIVIEDFGDKSYYKILLKSKNKLKIYKKLIDTLLKIQKIKPKFKIKNIDRGFHQINNYSKKYLLKESNLFFDWYLPLFISKNKALNIKKKSNKILSKLYNKLNSSDNCFVHRDYHIQNLLNVNKKVGLIDSQDALIGNPAYDLVSIIDDVRIKTSIQLKKKIYTYYIKKKFSKNQGDLNKFFEDFNILSVQRNLKIIGIFSRLFIRDQKKQYLKLLPYTWELLERRMNNKNFFLLKKILKENIPKSIRKKIIKK